jgi:membrane protease YdiL (CAAX protease family)
MAVMAFLLYLGAAASWPRPAWPLATGLLAAAYGWASALGLVRPAGVAAIAATMTLAWLCGRTPERARGVALHGAFLALALALFAHRVPGFDDPPLLGPVAFTPDAAPFLMRLNLDKAAVGFALLLLYAPLRRHAGVARSLVAGAGGAALGIALALPPALLLGGVRWAPKLPDGLWLWAANNLLLVASAEEALFRGFLQAGLARWLGGRAGGAWTAIGVAAAAFGVAHHAGGAAMVLLATVAGAAYGLAYRHGGLLAAVCAHFLLNLAHILLFAYPLLAPR